MMAEDEDTSEAEAKRAPVPLCELCKERERLYCCPRCSVKTCSLACCKAHKKQVRQRGRQAADGAASSRVR